MIESSGPPARSVERFWYEFEHFLNQKALDRSVADLCAVLVSFIEEAGQIGGEKGEQAKRAIVAFKDAAAKLSTPLPELPAPRLQEPKGPESRANNGALEKAMHRNRQLEKDIETGDLGPALDPAKVDIGSKKGFARWLLNAQLRAQEHWQSWTAKIRAGRR